MNGSQPNWDAREKADREQQCKAVESDLWQSDGETATVAVLMVQIGGLSEAHTGGDPFAERSKD